VNAALVAELNEVRWASGKPVLPRPSWQSANHDSGRLPGSLLVRANRPVCEFASCMDINAALDDMESERGFISAIGTTPDELRFVLARLEVAARAGQ
jgi:hypothetical protein